MPMQQGQMGQGQNPMNLMQILPILHLLSGGFGNGSPFGGPGMGQGMPGQQGTVPGQGQQTGPGQMHMGAMPGQNAMGSAFNNAMTPFRGMNPNMNQMQAGQFGPMGGIGGNPYGAFGAMFGGGNVGTQQNKSPQMGPGGMGPGR